ncbi:MAG: hypothetical protein ACYTAN_17470, partial [Planctomycetota bacterium]
SQDDVATTGEVKTSTGNEVSPEEGVPTDAAGSELTVAPALGLDDLIRDYEREVVENADRELGRAELVAKWIALRKAGRTRWGSENWMKDPQYYAGLDTPATPALALECFFSGPEGMDGIAGPFANEMAIHDDPVLGLESLRVFHDGFAELLQRDDMWKGMLVVYDRLSSQIDPQADLFQIVAASGQTDKMGRLYGLAPLKDQVKGREKIFLAANVRLLERYRDFLDTYDHKVLGTEEGSSGFFGEPCRVAQVALLLAKQIDAQHYARIEPAVTGVRWTREQKVEDLRRFIGLVLDSLDGFPMDDEARARIVETSLAGNAAVKSDGTSATAPAPSATSPEQ